MPATIVEFRALVDQLIDIGLISLRDLWRSLDLSRPDLVRAALLDTQPQLIQGLGDVAAVLAADTYDELRSIEAPDAPRFRAAIADPVPVEQAEAYVRWGIGPLFEDPAGPAFGDRTPGDVALSRLEGGFERLVQAPARDTIEISVSTDELRVGVARVPRDDACGFCTMLASRGAVYLTEDSALFRKSDHEKYHDNCRCTAWPVFHPDQLPEVNRRLGEEWRRVTGPARTPDEMRLLWNRYIDERNAAASVDAGVSA